MSDGYLNTDLAKSVATSVATTASVIVNSQSRSSNSNSNGLLTNKTFQKALGETLNNNKNQSLIQKHQNKDNLSIPLIRKSKIISRLQKDFNILNEDLLNDIPKLINTSDNDDENSVYSLFQGFNATLPEINETLEILKKGSSRLLTNDTSKLNDDYNYNFKNCDLNQLNHFQKDINYKLDLIEIKKNLTCCEIKEIDSKIQKLNEIRLNLFNKITEFELNENYYENQLKEIETMLENTNTNTNDNDDTDDSDVELLSKSIYGKIQSNEKANKSPLRKHKSTLQNYYKPNSIINEFQAHDDSITCLGFDSPFGKLVTASIDNTVKIWDLSRYNLIGYLEGHLSSVKCLQMIDNLVITGSLDANLKLWDINKKTSGDDNNNDYLLHTFESHIDEITALNFNNSNLVSGSNDKTIRQWDLNTGQCLQTIDVLWASSIHQSTHHINNNSSNNCKSSNTNTNIPFIGALQCYDAALASGTSDGIVRLWDLRSGEIIRQLIGHTNSITSLQFDDLNLITSSLDNSIRIWDLRTGNLKNSYTLNSSITSLQFDDLKIICTNMENSVKIYDRLNESHYDLINGEEEGDKDRSVVEYARYQDNYLVEGRQDGMVGIWAI
ncbi:hypothetical protein CANARDRAFT_25363 [[Candida] arabinofermentans NRRL YB-2248]|uniref:Uncharacterized protein n=1 Tax=[Candida] arabinofermentans NRRL YB-2248 TaxID=983967 RepID=A0A1E4SUE2_9ASCO|nr:hypothetical protein CANARDRAFT_25363 [[Candida] arabinofermentans NRRL YB-2248]